MADIIKEIRDLNSEIASLKESISKYDKEISAASATSAKVERMFAGYKHANTGAMSLKELTKATKELTEGYNALKSAKASYEEREKATLSTIQKLTEQNQLLAAAQRQALSNGDQQGATSIYQQYVANSQAIRQYNAELQDTRDTLEQLQEKTTSVGQVSDNFARIQQEVKAANSTKDIAALNSMYEQEKEELKGINAQIEEYAVKYKKTKSIIDGGGLTPEQMDEKTMELERYKNKLQELSNEYSVASQRAKVFAEASGHNPNGVSSAPKAMPVLSTPNVEFPDVDGKMKNLTASAKEAGLNLDDLIKKGVALGGLTFGAKQIADFGRQVMSVRSEFQQLEVAFTTLLGSEQKASKLMQQLTKTAATTPFDLQSVSKGAKQLLAYGTAAEDVNDILIHLGDIAAGLSQPLDALVYLYGTTMVQGKMMTMDLRQFQNRGIPIAEQLAKQFGVAKSEVQGLVSAGRVTSEEFHKAVMAMSSDGGKFAGLMEAQSKTIGGQISNIEDSISMMFNEIGKKSEGAINAGLGAVASLVENYETVGKVILSLIGVYGTYKTALIVVNALEKAKAATAMFNLVSGMKAISVTKMLTLATWKQVKAQLASNAAMLASPAGLITAGLVATGLAIWGVCRALDAQGRAQKTVNSINEKTKSQVDSTKADADEAISTIQSETATVYEKAAAYEKLKQIMPSLTEQYTLQQLAALDATEVKKAEAQALEDLTFKMKENAVVAQQNRINMLKQARDNATTQGNPIWGYNADIKAAEETLRTLQQQLNEAKKLRDQAEFDLQPKEIKIAKYTADIEGLKVELKTKQEDAEKLVAEAKKKWESQPENMKLTMYGTTNFDVAAGNNPVSVVGAEYVLLNNKIKELQGNISDTQAKIDALNGGQSSNIDKTIKEILAAEDALEAARKKYASDMSEQNKKDLETAESNLKTKTDLYQKATGQQWTATKELNKQIKQEDENLARERVSILEKEQSKRVQAATQYRNKIKDIEKEESEWKEKNPNRDVPEYFKQKKNVAYLEYKSNLKQLDDEFNDFIENIQRDTINIEADIDISNLERQLELASTSVSKKKALREEIFNKQLAQKTADLDKEKEETAEDKFGKKSVENYELYKSGGKKKGGWSKAEKETFAEMDLFYQEFAIKRQKTIEQMTQDHEWSEFNEELANYENYVQGMLDAEQEYQEQLKAIRERYGLSEDADVENSANKSIQAEVAAAQTERTRAQDIVKRDTGVENSEMVTELAELGGKVAGKAMEEIRKIYDEFISDINNQINEIEGQKAAVEKVAAGGDAQTLQQQAEMKLQTTQAQLTTGVGEDGEQLSEADKVALLEQEQQLKAEIAYYDQIIAGTAQDYNTLLLKSQQLVKVRSAAESEAANAIQGSLSTQKKQQQKVLKQTKASKDALLLVRDAADGIANTFGGALSQKGKKALNTMAEIADFGIQAVEGIETIVNGTTKGMQTTAEGASKAIQTAEKASFILTIISLAVQMVMKIVEIASQFTKGAQLQDAIDAHIEKVDELKKQQQLIEAQYATSQGSEYFLGMAKAAKSYEGIIDETNAALKDATELYEHYASKNADSDKAKEAKEQMQDLQQQRQEEINAQIEAERELMEGLSGTSLESFTSTLADSLIEGFKNGTEGIEDAWEDTMKNLKETMFREQLALALQDQFKDAFETLQKSTADGEMSESDMAAFLAEMEKAEANAKAIGEAYYTAFQESGLLDDADAEGSEGFGQMTQDQADTLTARFTAVQMEMANVSVATQAMAGIVTEVGTDIKAGVASIQSLLYNSNIALQIAQDQLDQMQAIADNTAMLNETNNRLKAIEQNTSKL